MCRQIGPHCHQPHGAYQNINTATTGAVAVRPLGGGSRPGLENTGYRPNVPHAAQCRRWKHPWSLGWVMWPVGAAVAAYWHN